MRKQILLFMFLAAVPLFAQKSEIVIQVDAPDNVVAGNNFEVAVTFSKGNLKDYSRFSQDLPAGFSAENISSPNADFSFDDQRVRIIWLKLPDEAQIKVSYSISVHERLSGTLELGGTFAYVDEGERAYLNIADSKKVTITANPDIDQTLVVDIADFDKITEGDQAQADNSQATDDNGNSTQSDDTQAGNFASVVRQLPQVEPNGIVNVSLLVKRPQGTNFLKLEESVPGGYSFEAVDVHGAKVSRAASLAKLVWMKPPTENNFLVKYRLIPILEKTQEPLVIDGNLTYTEEGKTKVASAREMEVNLLALNTDQQAELLAKGTIPQGLEEIAQTNSLQGNDPEETKVEPTKNATVVAGTSSRGASKTAKSYTKSAGGSLINVASLEIENGIYYRVQIAAVKKTYFANVIYAEYPLLREVRKETMQGWTKYTLGSFASFEAADAHKKKVIAETPINNAFVVAYRDGQRVPVKSVR